MWQQPASASVPCLEVADLDRRALFSPFERLLAGAPVPPLWPPAALGGSHDVNICLFLLVTEVVVKPRDCNTFLA